ncbi:MAG: hypothetical protein ABMA14_02835 [Hyphomonadaceae bacterium]
MPQTNWPMILLLILGVFFPGCSNQEVAQLEICGSDEMGVESSGQLEVEGPVVWIPVEAHLLILECDPPHVFALHWPRGNLLGAEQFETRLLAQFGKSTENEVFGLSGRFVVIPRALRGGIRDVEVVSVQNIREASFPRSLLAAVYTR